MNLVASVLWILTTLQLNEVTFSENRVLPEFPIVNLSQGAIKGKKISRANHEPYWTFLGIPYAKPPTGDLRFKAARDPEPWEGTLDALEERSICRQPSLDGRSFVGSEDCLYINVYTTTFPDRFHSKPLNPVMVWIHGGGFTFGSGNYDFQGPEFLIDKEIVYVSFNYRLGVLGFLNTEDEVIPGNAGSKDQVYALRWVQKNIAKFGGDPNQVTIFGESSGGASITHHLVSPMSKGLFHRAIAESGSAGIPWTPWLKPRETAFLISNALGFSGKTSTELADFLRNIPADALLNVSRNVYPEREKFRFTRMIYVPSVEVPVEGEEIFLSDNPMRLLERGMFNKVPFITGVNSAEGIIALLSGGILQNWSRVEEIDENFITIFKPELRLCKENRYGDEMIAKIKSFYFGNERFSNNTINNFIKFWTDMTFTENIIYGINNMISHSKVPVYLYEFSYDGSLGYFKRLIGADNFTGVCHADELGYIFNVSAVSPKTPKDLYTRDLMTTMWTNFAKTGNPTSSAADRIPTWHPYTTSSRNYLDIGDGVVNKKDLHKRRIDFWLELYAKYRKIEQC